MKRIPRASPRFRRGNGGIVARFIPPLRCLVVCATCVGIRAFFFILEKLRLHSWFPRERHSHSSESSPIRNLKNHREFPALRIFLRASDKSARLNGITMKKHSRRGYPFSLNLLVPLVWRWRDFTNRTNFIAAYRRGISASWNDGMKIKNETDV